MEGSSWNGDETGQLELVERAMQKVAAQHSPDIFLLGKLDRLRTDLANPKELRGGWIKAAARTALRPGG
jgi:hypothetical protein